LFLGCGETFRKIPGVVNTEVGYTGGHTLNPSYQSICQGDTNHAEVVLVEYDKKKISYDELLNHFWKCHDPTTLNRQGPDVGTQYRSAIFYFDDNQKKLATESKINFAKENNIIVVTEINQLNKYYKAEEYHQKYIQKTGLHCAV
tara:strand:+ start:540 stop:974 length:435 start_codon:yes stop_codon:yes gene_type:complete